MELGWGLSRGFRALAAVAGVVAALAGDGARAEFSQYDTATYDWVNLGTPKFINTNYLDLRKITKISKFRSHYGHEYSDNSQFGADYIKLPGIRTESCRSMKHYFVQPDELVDVYAPVSGVISRVFEEELGTQIHITADDQPAFTIAIFHVKTDIPAVVGDHVSEGQHLGKHFTVNTNSDVAVMVHAPQGYHLVSYFDALTDAAFAPFKARGLNSPADISFSREQAEASTGCTGFQQPPADSDFINLTPAAASQTITVRTSLSATHFANDPPLPLDVVSSAGLPVTMISLTPKTCIVNGTALAFRRAGSCQIQLSQPGNADTFAAQTQTAYATVLPAGATPGGRPRLSQVYPPSASGPQSYIRLINPTPAVSSAKLTLSDAATGQDLFTWSGAVPAPAAPQYSIADLEKAAPAGFVRPAMYGLRFAEDPPTALYIQHVLYRTTDGTLTNVTTCANNVFAGTVVANVHSSKIGALGFPSTIVLHNTSGFDNLNQFLDIYDGGTGATLANSYYPGGGIKLNAALMLKVADIEAAAKLNPANIYHYVMVSRFNPGLIQHLINNQAAGLVTDMTATCNIYGSNASPLDPLRTGALFSGRQTTQSYLRFTNVGLAAGTVTVTLYDSATGANVGTWTSPTIAPNAETQVGVAEIEAALGGAKADTYEMRAETSIDGLFQHVLYRPTDGTLTNLSTCLGSTSADPYTLTGVHSSLLAAGFPSAIIVNNSDTKAITVSLGIYDARDGSRLGSFTTPPIPAGAQANLSVAAIEAAMKVTPSSSQYHYVIKAEQPFNGYLQHLVNNKQAGTITDMTTVCLM